LKGVEDMETKAIQANLPKALVKKMEAFIKDGWFSDIDTLIGDALRRFLEAHQPELMEHFIQEDVEWGLHGEE
jgi:metal-responsive CopG/Arc/MetJ family transcriptional regulator